MNQAIVQSLSAFVDDPATSDFQRGYLRAVIDMAELANVLVPDAVRDQLIGRVAPRNVNPARDAQRKLAWERRDHNRI